MSRAGAGGPGGRATERTVAERVADVRRLLVAAQAVHADRARLAPEIVRTTGLSPEGVELGFASLELDADDRELASLVAAAGDAEHVHVVLSANVFVAALRALAIARAAAPAATVRPSPRDPVLARALVDAAADGGLSLVDARDLGAIADGEVHVYGRDETIDAVRRGASPGVVVRGHGAGMGIAVVGADGDVDAAAGGLALDAVAFDQRGCLSPRIAFVEGDARRAEAFARALDRALAGEALRVPRGALHDDEAAAARRWRDAVAFAGTLWAAEQHAVALVPLDAGLAALPPPGRHVLVVPLPSVAALPVALGPLARFVVAAGSDAPERLRGIAPAHARLSSLGRMQRPPLDGPVDRRPSS